MKRSLSLLALLLAAVVVAQDQEPEVHGTYHGDPMYAVLPLDGIPAIRDPEFVSGEAADAQMSDDEPVLGIELDGDARAYSLWHLDHHEIVNDVVGGRSIAATW
jgi:hypothetical protein